MVPIKIKIAIPTSKLVQMWGRPRPYPFISTFSVCLEVVVKAIFVFSSSLGSFCVPGFLFFTSSMGAFKGIQLSDIYGDREAVTYRGFLLLYLFLPVMLLYFGVYLVHLFPH